MTSILTNAVIHAGNVEECKQFFNKLYKFAYLQGTYLKPHVSTRPALFVSICPAIRYIILGTCNCLDKELFL